MSFLHKQSKQPTLHRGRSGISNSRFCSRRAPPAPPQRVQPINCSGNHSCYKILLFLSLRNAQSLWCRVGHCDAYWKNQSNTAKCSSSMPPIQFHKNLLSGSSGPAILGVILISAHSCKINLPPNPVCVWGVIWVLLLVIAVLQTLWKVNKLT